MKSLPFSYAANCKRNKANGLPFIVDNLADDFVIIAIAFAFVSPSPVATVLALLCLHFSLWAIYEAGYFENDVVAATLEPNGKVPQNFEAFRESYSETLAWLAATALAAVGIVIAFAGGIMPAPLQDAGMIIGGIAALVVWLGFLVALRLTYRTYNHADKLSRTFLYLPLQLFKYAFGAIFFALPAAGAALIFSQICRRWIPYVVYRHVGAKPDDVEPRVIRLMVFVSLWLVLLPAAFGFEHFLVGAVAFAFLLARTQSRLRALMRRATVAKDDKWRAAS